MKHLAHSALALTLSFSAVVPFARAQATETLTVDTRAAATPFPHFWEQTFGSGRAILSLRESYRSDLRSVKSITGFENVRFHAIFLDDVGLYDPDRQSIQFAQEAGNAPTKLAGIYNFSYVDQIYDGLLANNVRPYVELSFMPKKMASDPNAIHPFWYKQNVSPPADYAKWDAMISAFAQHLVERYGIEEVSRWPFEVWNEPNIDFWAGSPKQSTYFELYAHTARALKNVSPRLRVGGPATAQAAWVGDFLAFCKQNNVPVDFASTHVYANDTAPDVFHTKEIIPRDTMVARAVQKVHNEIAASPFPQMPLYFSEYNASYANEPNVTDTTYMGPWLASTIAQCDGLVQNMAYWSFSDVFEEQGVVRTPFYGGFGLMAEDGIPKPSFNVFAILHKLGSQRLPVTSAETRTPTPEQGSTAPSAIATRTAGGSLVVALWNYAAPVGTGARYTPQPAALGANKAIHLALAGPHAREATVWRVDGTHSNVLPAYDAMGRPATPSREQIQQLREAGKLSPPEHMRLTGNALDITLPPQGLAVIEINK